MTAKIHIIDLHPDNAKAIKETASLLFRGFREHNPNGWPNIEAAVKEVEESLQEGHISRIAVNNNGNVVGWIGGIGKYQGHVWELHPLVVDPDHQHPGPERSRARAGDPAARGSRGSRLIGYGAAAPNRNARNRQVTRPGSST